MTTDSSDSHRKHRRSSSDDDSSDTSKRHKHRHNHRRHKSSKHDGPKITEIESRNKPEYVIAPKCSDYEMEEGEIIEDGEILTDDGHIDDKSAAVASDVESGELDDRYTGDDDAIDNDKNGDHSNWLMNYRHEESPDSIANGNSRKKSSKVDFGSHRISKSPSGGGSSKYKDKHRSESKQRNSELMDVDGDPSGDRRTSLFYKVRDDCDKSKYRSPSHGRYHLDTSDRSRSESPYKMRDRERSRSILHEGHSTRQHPYERDYGEYYSGRVDYELEGEHDSYVRTDYRVYGRERAEYGRRERSSSCHRYSKHEDDDSLDREQEKMVLREKKRVKEQELVRERNYRDWEYEQDRYEKEHDREREHKRDSNRGRSRDRDHERDRRRDTNISSYRDRDRDLDRGFNRDRNLEMDRGRDKYGARDRYEDQTNRSRRHRYDDHDNEHNGDRCHVYDEQKYQSGRNREHELGNDQVAKDDSQKEIDEESKRDDDDDQKGYQERVELELAEQEEDDVDRIKEESRRRREAILQKYRAKQTQQVVSQDSKDDGLKEQLSQKSVPPNVGLNGVKEQHSQKSVSPSADLKGISYEKSDSQQASKVYQLSDVGMSPLKNESTSVGKITVAGGLGEGSPKSERSNEMFCDDIFGDSPAGVRKKGKGDDLPVESGLHDNWDDPEGYYSFRLGEILDSRYEVIAAQGKGVFSTVVRAKNLKPGTGDPEEVAIKIIRNNETMLKAGTEELVILKRLVCADPNDRKHCVRYLSNFKYRNHLCIVFESLHMNLREVLKKFGRNIGLKLTAVRTYATQLFIALRHLRKCGVLHSDIKPDNMLVNEAKNVLKLCDFGNAMFSGKNEITPYLVSRFYRAPEIILGLPYDHPMDMWSVGCCLYELYTGKVLFPGATNNDMLRLHMELKGPFPKKMLRKGAFIEQHFDQDLNFLAIEEDPVTKKAIRRLIHNIKPKDISTIIKGSAGEDPKMLANFKDLLDKIFVLDPDKRQTAEQALIHPFITGK